MRLSQARQDFTSGVSSASGHQKARRFRDEHQAKKENKRRNNLDPKHPLPCLEAEPKRSAGRTCGAGEKIIAEKSQEQAEDDRELLERSQPPSNPGGSDFADVGRTNNAGPADGQPAHHSIGDEIHRTACDSRTPRAPNKKNRGNDQDRATAPFVGKSAGDEGAEGATKQDRGDVKPRTEIRGVK